jgi:L,D-transpeptidase ErfK/SrfK
VLIFTTNQTPAPIQIQPVVGHDEIYVVTRRDNLYRVARKYDIGLAQLLRANGLSSPHVRPGTRLIVPTSHILPNTPHDGIVLNIPERRIYIFRDGNIVATHAVAVGKPTTQTATGQYHLAEKKRNPIWRPPKSIVDKEGIADDPVAPGPSNPLGDRWMGWSLPGYGFHSTNAPRSVGYAASHGCVRLYPERAREMFDEVNVGMPIYAIYDPVAVGKRDGIFYLSVAPDIYASGQGTEGAIKHDLAAIGLLPYVDADELHRLISLGDFRPHPIAGRNVQVRVNGTTVPLPIAPIMAGGEWVVPVRPLVQALGGGVDIDPEGATHVSLNGHTLTLQPGTLTSEADSDEVSDKYPASVIEGTLVAPLRVLARGIGLSVTDDGGKTIDVRSAGPTAEPTAQ